MDRNPNEASRPERGRQRGKFEAPRKKSILPGLLTALVCAAAVGLLVYFVVIPILRGDRTAGSGEALASSVPAITDSAPETAPSEPASTAPVSTEPVTTEPVTTEPVTTEPLPTEPPTEPLPEPTPTDIDEGPADVTGKPYQAGTVYIVGGKGYGGYYFNESNSGRYCEAVSNVARALEGKADVYCLICPISTGIMLSDETRQAMGYSDENAAMAWMYEQMDPLVKAVPVYGALKSRNDEYIYFGTDHHWTALGAYYAYREFCAQKGIRPHEPEDYETYVFEGYKGSFINYSNGNAELKANPDTVTAYIPNGTNTMTTYMPSGSGYAKYTWDIVKDASSYNSGSYYLCFVAGDQPYSYAHNETITDGSSVLVVKDSYGNAFIPFLIDHYEHIYWIDYRSYKDWCPWAGVADSSISNFVERNNIQDVILCNNISSTGSKTLIGYMEPIFK